MSMSDEEEEMLEEMGVKGTPMGRKNQNPKSEVVRSDLEQIKCDVCRKVVDLAYANARETLEKRFRHKSKRKNEFNQFEGEATVQDHLEKVCVADKPNGPGEWIRYLDLVSDGERLVMYENTQIGHCERECRTIERACEDVIEAADTEFSEILYEAVKEGTALEKVQRLVCNRAAKVCKTKPPKLAPNRVDYPFRAMTAEEKQMADMMANLKDSGMGGTMYRREDLMKGMDSITEKLGSLAGDPEGAMPDEEPVGA